MQLGTAAQRPDSRLSCPAQGTCFSIVRGGKASLGLGSPREAKAEQRGESRPQESSLLLLSRTGVPGHPCVAEEGEGAYGDTLQ